MSHPPPPVPTNPFPGLRPFTQEEDHLFFGREEQTLELLRRLGGHRFVAVVGTSGSGKSSLVRCGLLSELLGGGMLGAGASWEVAVTHPGGNPLGILADALLDAHLYDRDGEDARANLLATLGRSHFGLVEAVRQARLGPDANFLLVVDQFEELFRFHEAGQAQQEAANEFVSLLLEAVAQRAVPVYVVLTMRSDFIGECGRFEGLAELVNRGEFLIPGLTRDQYKRVIEGPVRVAGGRIAPRLLQRLLNDLGQQADQLPCLQHALMRTWDVWAERGGTDALDLEDYQRVGGMAQALSLHADEVYAALGTDRQRQLCEALFQALTVQESEGRGIRRPQRLDRLCRILDVPADELKPILDAYRRPGVTFLMPPPDVELTDRTVIDISHESLMRVWDRLRRWVEEEAQAAGIYRRLAESAGLHGQGRAGLYRDPELGIALAWLEARRPNAAWAERYRPGFDPAMAFLQASRDAAAAEEQAREAARRHELDQARALAEAQQLRLNLQQRSARKLRRMVAGLAAVAVIAGLACVAALLANDRANRLRAVASEEAGRAKQSALDATAQREAAQRARLDAVDNTYLATLNEVRAMRLARQSGWRSTALDRLGGLGRLGSRNLDLVELRTEALACLAVPDVRLRSKSGSGSVGVWRVRYSPDGQILAVSDGKNRRVFLQDLTTDQELPAIPKPSTLAPFAFHPSGTLAVTNAAGRVAFHPLKPGQPSFPEIAGDGHAVNLAFSRSGDRLAVVWDTPLGKSTENRPRVAVYETATGTSVWSVDTPANTTRSYKFPLALSPDGRLLATAGPDAEVRLYTVGTQDEPTVLGKLDGRVSAVDFRPDGQALVAAGILHGAAWDLKSRSELYRIHAPEGGFWDVAYSPDGQLIAGACNDQVVRLWEARSGRELAAVPTEQGTNCLSVAFSPEGDRFAVGSRTAYLFEVEGRREYRYETSQVNRVSGLAFDRARAVLYFCGGESLVRAWSLDEAAAGLLRPTGRSEHAMCIRVSPDNRNIAVGFGVWVEGQASPSDFSVSVWRADDPAGDRRLKDPKRPVLDLAFSPGGRRLAAASADGGVYCWDFASGDLRFRAGLSGARSVRFVDDDRLLVGGANRLVLLAASDGSVVREVALPAAVAAVVVTPDGTGAFVLTADGTVHRVRLSDLALERSRMAVERPSIPLIAVSPDGALLAVTSQAGPHNMLIDSRTLEPIARLPGADTRVSCLAFDDDGRRLALGGAGVALWDLALVRSELKRLGLDAAAISGAGAVALSNSTPVHAAADDGN